MAATNVLEPLTSNLHDPPLAVEPEVCRVAAGLLGPRGPASRHRTP
ncbi:hypothetical protein [Terrabacter sp. 2RAF25]